MVNHLPVHSGENDRPLSRRWNGHCDGDHLGNAAAHLQQREDGSDVTLSWLPAGKRLGSSKRSQLQSDSAWADSRFNALEGFISDYLAGGASAGEGVRLKLQTPLFVSEALLDTAQKQLADLLATAEEVRPPVALTCLRPSSKRCCLLGHASRPLCNCQSAKSIWSHYSGNALPFNPGYCVHVLVKEGCQHNIAPAS